MKHTPESWMARRLGIGLVTLLHCAGAAWAQGTPASTTAGPVQVRFTTTLGAFTLELDGARAPLTVANFTQYVRDGHYAGTIFHRVIGNFVAQAGGYTADGTEKPTRPAVFNESGNGLSNRRGTVAMARTDDPHSATSQFYVNLVDNLSLDPGPSRWGYAVFGRVTEGMDVIQRIASVPTGAKGPFEDDAPLEPIVIESAEIVGPAAAVVPAPAK
ncbi:MAG TPA: peptidylprolyl isomerase [Steroidobacteraceae bacterium]|nr:peptidylprolyl isomerase [Steroidobacteraceae bacterium]